MINSSLFREGETVILATIMSLTGVDHSTATIVQGLPAVSFQSFGQVYSLRLLPDCSTAFLIGPLLLFGAGLMVTRRWAPTRVAVATVTAAAAVVALNQARLVVLCLAVWRSGVHTFNWLHSLAGGVFLLLGLVSVLASYFFFLSRGTHTTTEAMS